MGVARSHDPLYVFLIVHHRLCFLQAADSETGVRVEVAAGA